MLTKKITYILALLVFLVLSKMAFNVTPSDYQWLLALWSGVVFGYFMQKVFHAN